MGNIQSFSASGIKAFFELVNKYCKIEQHDTPYVRDIKSLLKDIALSLETNDFNRIAYYNHLAARRYGYVVRNNSRLYFREAAIENIANLGIDMTVPQLELIAEGLIDEIKACKEKERIAAFFSVLGGYARDKVIDALISR